jgi:superfamily II DNA or RNA helicase
LYDRYRFKLKKFTGETKNREAILGQFSEGKLDALLAMKCLDEGVDVPQTKYAIFCSSTGNPRQYIQRRGRVLRQYKVNGKEKEFAFIYDMVVKPILDPTNTDEMQIRLEKNIFNSELKRLVNFAVLAENKIEVLKSLEDLCCSFDIDIYDLANIEEEKYNI